MNREKLKAHLKEYAGAFIEACVIFMILYVFFWPMGIDGNSMEATLSHNDRVVMSRALAAIGAISHGDLVICKAYHGGEEKDIIKRIIAVPGDHLQIHDGKVYLNGALLDESYVSGEETYGQVDILLENGEYFVLGDNRGVSYDSRQFGALPKNKISGKVILKWFPLNQTKIY